MYTLQRSIKTKEIGVTNKQQQQKKKKKKTINKIKEKNLNETLKRKERQCKQQRLQICKKGLKKKERTKFK